MDGAFCDYGEKEKIQFLNDCHAAGVLNIEMESLCFAAMCHHAGLKGDMFVECDLGMQFATFYMPFLKHIERSLYF